MENLFAVLFTLIEDPLHARWLLAGGIGIAVTLLGVGVMVIISGMLDPLRQRLRVAADSTIRSRASATEDPGLLQSFAILQPHKGKEVGRVRRRLVYAGYRSPHAPATFYASKLLSSLGSGSVVFLLAPFFPQLGFLQIASVAFVVGFCGLIAPHVYLNRRVAIRQKVVVHSFPDALDLLVCCTEAGLGLNGAIQRVAQELQVSHPVLASELELVNNEIRAGVNRVQALKELANRTGIEEIRGLVTMLAQSVKFGSSIADTLRVYAEDLRDRRMQTAEENAAKISTKMIFPLVLCLFPGFFLVAVGPAIIGVVRVFEGM